MRYFKEFHYQELKKKASSEKSQWKALGKLHHKKKNSKLNPTFFIHLYLHRFLFSTLILFESINFYFKWDECQLFLCALLDMQEFTSFYSRELFSYNKRTFFLRGIKLLKNAVAYDNVVLSASFRVERIRKHVYLHFSSVQRRLELQKKPGINMMDVAVVFFSLFLMSCIIHDCR